MKTIQSIRRRHRHRQRFHFMVALKYFFFFFSFCFVCVCAQFSTFLMTYCVVCGKRTNVPNTSKAAHFNKQLHLNETNYCAY